jgi:hypothetical protein
MSPAGIVVDAAAGRGGHHSWCLICPRRNRDRAELLERRHHDLSLSTDGRHVFAMTRLPDAPEHGRREKATLRPSAAAIRMRLMKIKG